MKRRNLILLLGGASSGAMSVGTGAFSSMEAERGVSVDVVSDDQAFVGYRSDDRTLPNDLNDDGTIDLVTVTNRFTQEIEFVDAAIDDGGEFFGELNIPDGDISPGDPATVTATPTFEPGDEIKVAVTIQVKGAGVSAEVFGDTETRQFTVTREKTESSSVVHYNGKGTINVESQTENNDTIEIKAYSIPNGSSSEQDKQNSLSSPQTVDIEPNKNENLTDWIVAVEVNGSIYRHPGWDESACKFNGPDGGPGVHVNEPPSCE
ncbi:hypothetical protein [Halorubrum sp. F4]|uniref:hypothetical protein n=1 Tax=Halorubrum sp. F4 TaxID=2989715 RepID=UPI00248137D7|nr:hypothetical protein [Halorubrum sp. F4]